MILTHLLEDIYAQMAVEKEILARFTAVVGNDRRLNDPNLSHELYGLRMEVPDQVDRALSRWYKPAK